MASGCCWGDALGKGFQALVWSGDAGDVGLVVPACGGLNDLVNVLESGVLGLPLGVLHCVCALEGVEDGSLVFFELGDSSGPIGLGYSALDGGYRGLDEVRYRRETGVDEIPDVL